MEIVGITETTLEVEGFVIDEAETGNVGNEIYSTILLYDAAKDIFTSVIVTNNHNVGKFGCIKATGKVFTQDNMITIVADELQMKSGN